MGRSSGARRELAARLGMPVPPRPVAVLGARVRQLLGRAHRRSVPPIASVMESMLAIYDNRVLGLLVSTGVADQLNGSDEPMPVEELASATGTDPDGLDRVLGYAAARGFVARRGGRYRPTAVTRSLSDGSDSMRPWVEFLGSSWCWDAVRNLDAGLAVPPRSGIEAATGHEFFHYVNEVEPEAGRAFNGAMASGSPLQALGLAAVLDWTGVASICDVGGGTGATGATLVRHLDGVEVTVLDLPSVVAQMETSDRLHAVGGSFFEQVPAGHDRYLLLAIVHDWSDDEAVALLRVVADAMSPTARAVVVESPLDQPGMNEFTTATDLLMLSLATGRERTRAQHEALFGRAGLVVDRRHFLPSGFVAYELALVGE